MGSPRFIGIGAQKAGTTWWYDLIADHPCVDRPNANIKELHYFSQFATKAFGPAEITAYHRWFPLSDVTISGEWTPDYLYLPWVPYLVSLAAPETRILVCLRDPIERFRAGMAHSDLNLQPYTSPIVADSMAQGFYAALLSRWLHYFRRDQILILQFERNVSATGAQIARTYEFLGLDSTYEPTNLVTKVYKTPLAKVDLDDDTRRRLVDVYLPDVLQLKELVPDIDLSLWPNFSDRI